jgi:membrane-bound serine protease (ClpP class)
MKTILILILLIVLSAAVSYGERGRVSLVELSGPVNPITAEYIGRTLKESARQGDRLFLVEIDTPGGLDSSMRLIVKDIFASPVPVAIYVAPSGARAASAGAIIAISADFCAMAPGTNIGAAHPVSIGSQPDKVMQEKALKDMVAYVEGIAGKRGRNVDLVVRMVRGSDSFAAEKALEGKIIDFIAADRSELIRRLAGRSIMRGGKSIVLNLSDIDIIRKEMGTRERILNVISNPDVAYVLLMLGFLGLFFELSHPGVILPGVIGGISLILAFFAFQTLPVNYAGVLLILLALILFIAEIKIVSHGMLTVGGMISMILGSLLLFDSSEPYARVSWGVIFTTIAIITILCGFVVRKVIIAHKKRPSSGREGLIGEKGVADTDIGTAGKVFVRGEYWNAWSEETISKGEGVVVLDVERMRLKVTKG